MRALRRLDDLLARGEAALAALLLVAMIVAASSQALLRNLTLGGARWANALLGEVDWIDSFLQIGTLWIAFLGASLAAHADRHLAIDALPRLAPPRPRAAMRAVALLGAGVTCLFLARVFLLAVLNLGAVRPLELEVLAAGVPVHVCDAPAAAVAAASLVRPAVFCAARAALAAVGLPVEAPVPALELVAPLGFLVVGLRLAARGVALAVGLSRGEYSGQERPPGGHGP